ncbi:PAS domain S-box-containing protein [Salinibacillus kushneri]|uniref:histidine kinase n=1 Tax=Salinibacillus kushneri TaxID=237682 RepID=A0A1I0DKW2_9BACI|nr:PAS domain-containing protein [Salinibacillus kushneri]SET33112.1 PAS domain S-box-containing protein [Salinibacillus kushneri]
MERKYKMDYIFTSANPMLLFLAIVLTFMASYTALDLFTLIRSSDRNKEFLFLGGITSMGIGIWVMNVLVTFTINTVDLSDYNIPLEILSVLLGIIFIGIAFYNLVARAYRLSRLFTSSFFLTLAVFCFHVLGVYSMNYTMSFSPFILFISLVMIFVSFLFSLWLLFSKKYSYNRRGWLRPVSTLIITLAIIEGYFLLSRASSFYNPEQITEEGIRLEESFVFYVILFMSVLILTGLIVTSTLVSKRLASSYTNLQDIYTALDASSIVAITDEDGTITYANDKFADISKYSKDELIGSSHNLLKSGNHSNQFFENMWSTITKGRIWKGEICNRAKDGTLYWVDTTIVPFVNKNRKPSQYVSIRTDITNRKLAEEQLKSSLKENKDFKFALDQSSIVAITDKRGKIIYANDKFCEISKYSHEELIGQDHRILNSGYHPKTFFKDLWRTIGTGHVWKGEICNRAKDGSIYWVNTTIVPFLDENNKPYQYIAIRTDITERKRTEEYLHRQDKLAAVGQLAAGVAHEIRNPLTFMQGYAEFLAIDEQDEQRQEFLEIILDEINRVDLIVEDFMVLAKPKDLTMEVKNLVSTVENVLSLLDYDARKQNVSVAFQADKEEMKVVMDENRMKQVILNLVKNAIEAMPEGGNLQLDMDYVQEKDETFVHVAIADNGIGISEQNLKKISDPFYTTKENGNGLGLMISYKIVENHKGKIDVDSVDGEGTTFHIFIPQKED